MGDRRKLKNLDCMNNTKKKHFLHIEPKDLYTTKHWDLRLRILMEFNDLENSTAETVANKWLSDQHSDLGTIRRAVIDLIEFDYLKVSETEKLCAISWLNKEWDSTTYNSPQTKDDEDKKSSLRLIQKVGQYDKVSKVRLYTSVKGIVFIQEHIGFKMRLFHKGLLTLVAATITFIVGYILG